MCAIAERHIGALSAPAEFQQRSAADIIAVPILIVKFDVGGFNVKTAVVFNCNFCWHVIYSLVKNSGNGTACHSEGAERLKNPTLIKMNGLDSSLRSE